MVIFMLGKSLVLNSGSSSIKFRLFDEEESILYGLCDAIGLENSKFKYNYYGTKEEKDILFKDNEQALNSIIELLKEKNLLKDLGRIVHRAVHGGEKFKETILINSELISQMEKLIPLAPLHNPANIEGMKLMNKVLPNIKQYAVFDTAFHSTIPKSAYLYPVPYSWYKEYGVRRYGFHGSSHQYVIEKCMKYLDKPDSKIISCHLGNGASICAADSGISVDTSMGMTPLEGLMMGTRSGTIDPSIIEYMVDKTGLGYKQITEILNKGSGLKGVSELTSDMRPLEENRETDEASSRTMGLYLHRLYRVFGALTGTLGGIDAIVFTGGVGEKSSYVRERLCNQFSFLGINLDMKKNENNFEGEINALDSKIKVFVIPTNEELQMVRNAINLEKKFIGNE